MRKPSAILMLTLALMLAAISAPRYKAFAEETEAAFKDTTGHWAESEIREAVKAGYVSGYEDARSSRSGRCFGWSISSCWSS